MAIVFIDGGDHYETLTDKYDSMTEGATCTPLAGQSGGYFDKCVTNTVNTANYYITKTLTASGQFTVGIRLRIKYAYAQIKFLDDTTVNGAVRIYSAETTGITTVYIYDNLMTSAATVNLGTDPVDRWLYMEVQMAFTDTATCTVRIDDEQVLQVTTTDFRGGTNTTSNKIELLFYGHTASVNKWDDLYVDNSLTFHGDTVIHAIVPTSDVSVNFNRSTGSDNYALVDEKPPTGDTDYNYKDAAGLDKFVMGDISTTGEVIALQTNLYVREESVGDDPGTHEHSCIYGSSGTQSKGAQIDPTTSYRFYTDIFALDPDTSAAWTVANVNSLNAGYLME